MRATLLAIAVAQEANQEDTERKEVEEDANVGGHLPVKDSLKLLLELVHCHCWPVIAPIYLSQFVNFDEFYHKYEQQENTDRKVQSELLLVDLELVTELKGTQLVKREE